MIQSIFLSEYLLLKIPRIVKMPHNVDNSSNSSGSLLEKQKQKKK